KAMHTYFMTGVPTKPEDVFVNVPDDFYEEDVKATLDDYRAQRGGVYQPSHYARFVIEPITFIEANDLQFWQGNAIKYVCRYDAKNGIEDLRKAIRYIEIGIEKLERLERIDEGELAADVWSVTL